MELCPPTLGKQTGGSVYPELFMPPGLNREQAWAWALDNFDALSHHSCQCLHNCRDMKSERMELLHWASCQQGADPAVERGQKRHRDPHVHGPVAENKEELQSPQEEGDATISAAQWTQSQSDGRVGRGGQTEDQSVSLSPGRPRKLLKTKA
jgi:hypothetical protein